MHCLIFNINKRLTDSTRAPGAYRIAHFIREHGWDAEVIEYATYWDLPRLQALAQSRITKNTKWIGTSHMFPYWTDTMETFLLWVKQQYPWIKIIYGSAANPSFNSQAIDYYIQGYGEYALLELLKYLFSNGSAPRFDLLSSGAKKVIAAIANYPAFPMSSLMIKYQDRDFILPGEWLAIECSRGCKFACDHCNYPVIGVKGDHTRDAEDFREQIMDAYDRWGVTGYYVADETFNDRTDKITKFADVVETLPFDPWFSGYIRADLLVSRPRDREELARMGFRGHFYGIESFNRNAAQSVGKSMDPDRLKAGLIEIRDYFKNTGCGLYSSTVSLILGLPTETPEEINNTVNWIRACIPESSLCAHVLIMFQSEIDKTSKMSINYQKYGYEKMSDSEIAAELAKEKKIIIPLQKNNLDVNRFVMWKNPQMNIFDAAVIEQNIHDEWNNIDCPNGHGTDIFRLSSAVIHELDLKARVTIDSFTMNQMIIKKQQQILEDYVEKKLSL